MKKKGFSAIEMILVVSIISTLTVICFWPQKGIYRMSREVLLEDFVVTLNQNVELYKVCALELDPKVNLDFPSKEKVLEALSQGISGEVTPLMKASLKTIDHVDWDFKEQQFIVKTNNNTREKQ